MKITNKTSLKDFYRILTTHAGNPGQIPWAISSASNGGNMSLDEAVHALVSYQGVDLIAWTRQSECASIVDQRWLTAGHCWECNNMNHLYLTQIFTLNKSNRQKHNCKCLKPNANFTLTCAFLAGESEVVVAGNIIPLAVLVPDHYYTVFPWREETVWLVWSPVLILLQGKNMDIAETSGMT